MKSILFFIDSVNTKEEVIQKILANPSAKRTLNLLGASMVCILSTIFILSYLIFTYYTPIQRPLLYVNLNTKEIRDLSVLPYPQQSRQSLQLWVGDAVRDLNSLSFEALDEQLESHRRYFLDDAAHASYVQQQVNSPAYKQIIKNSIRVSTVLLKDPFEVGTKGLGAGSENRYWLYRVPVLMNYNTGNKRTTAEKKMVEVLVVRVPAYKNHQGLAIARMKIT